MIKLLILNFIIINDLLIILFDMDKVDYYYFRYNINRNSSLIYSENKKTKIKMILWLKKYIN